MITRFANEIGTILMIAPARRAPTLTLMISNTCYHLLVVVKGSSRLVMEFGNRPQGQGCSGIVGSRRIVSRRMCRLRSSVARTLNGRGCGVAQEIAAAPHSPNVVFTGQFDEFFA